MYDVALNSELFIGDNELDWVKVCFYLSINIFYGKYFSAETSDNIGVNFVFLLTIFFSCVSRCLKNVLDS